MYDNYNYPPGADNEDAPWNEPTVPEKDFEVTCSQTLSRTAEVWTNNYIPGASGVDYEYDIDGPVAVGWHDEDDTSNVNWTKEYQENGYYTPLQLINLLREYLQKDLENVEEIAKAANKDVTFLRERLKHRIAECECWTEDETEIIQS